MFRTTLSMMTFATLAVTGCSTSDQTQTISGRIAPGSFPEAVTSVRAIGNSGAITAQVQSDGSFALALPAGDRYRIELVSSSRVAELVYARGGSVGASFFVASSVAPFDLGKVVYAKDADSGAGGGGDTGTGGGGDTGTGGGGDTGTGGGGDTGTGGGGDTGTGGGGDTGMGGGNDTGAHEGGDTGVHACGDAKEPEGSHTSGDGATSDHAPPDSVGCDAGDGDGEHDGGAGGGDTGTGGGGDTGTGGGETGGGGSGS